MLKKFILNYFIYIYIYFQNRIIINLLIFYIILIINNVKIVFNDLYISCKFNVIVNNLLKKYYFLKSIKIIINSFNKINALIIIIKSFKNDILIILNVINYLS